MPRLKRVSAGGVIYHALNRANGRTTLFHDDGDYGAFERVLAEAVERFPGIRLLCYCLMPNHWHLVLWPRREGELSRFMRWLTLTHAQRRHAHRHRAGEGHVYQGRFKSFPVKDDRHFLVAARYVERNPLRARLVRRAEQWPWCSLRRRRIEGGKKRRGASSTNGVSDRSTPAVPELHPWPVPEPKDWVEQVNRPMSGAEERAMRDSIQRGRPFGDERWQERTALRLGLQPTLRPRGRPRQEPQELKGESVRTRG
jgi:putative transposase